MSNDMHETLGSNVIPVSYDIKIEPDMKNFVFDGSEQVDVTIAKETNEIAMNAKELNISKVEIINNGRLYPAAVAEDKKRERIVFKISKKIKGRASINITFKGTNNDRMYGFYRSRYTNSKTGKEEYLLTTQFEAADARSAFPCFDEPAFKATFSIELIVDKGLDAISNMPVSRIVHEGQKDRFIFGKTPRMSTYLVYLGVGKFEYLKGALGKLPIRVVTVPGKIGYAKLALSLTRKFVSFYEGYFGIKYPMPKLDMIAIPDFAAGAMENWGAITFREIAILGDENTSTAIMQNIANTIAHELAHQWFGDLVTMQWWNDLWLNESFATFMSYKAVNSAFPKWDMHTQEFLETNAVALGADQLESTHPISVKVNSPAEIDEIFDAISYEKGGSILKMLEDYVGYDLFRQGLHEYLKRHAHGNATKYDLWSAINKVAERAGLHLNVSNVAKAWIENVGYPLLEVDNVHGKFSVSQHRFALLGSNEKTIWPVPLRYMDAYGEHFEMLDKPSKQIRVRGNYVKMNYGQKGFYRVKYDKDMLQQLGEMILHNRLTGLDAWGIENDLYAMTISRNASIEDYLNFVEHYCVNAEYPLNYSISEHISSLFRRFYVQEAIAGKVKKVGISYYNGILSRIGVEKKQNEPNTATLLRGAAILGLEIMDSNGGVAKRMLKLYNAKLHGRNIDSNISGNVYTIAAWTGDSGTFDEIIGLYKKEQLPEEQRKLLGSTGYFKSAKLLNKALDFSLSKDVRSQDSFIIAARVSSNPVGNSVIWEWTERNWKTLKGRYDSGTHMLGRFIGALSCISDNKREGSIKRFFSKKENRRADITRALRQTLEYIKINRLLIEHAEEKAH
ncbi:MAG: M1 family metallopeptidase [Candidatus Marsarchaeota archaeon]|jgi:tricorn protease interacting factor F2/3|nr:M1 family metallopeptidase [Candidatus Marsarchaeota archaeon]MCL5419131.1 M1 family metallopeptidase [Candidatus Marsarchaeota archaeon]